jgi:anion transporter
MLKAKGQSNRIISVLLGALICGVFYFLPVPETLARCAAEAGSDGLTAMHVLGGILLAIVWWIGGVFPHWITTITMLLLWVVLGRMPFTMAFSSYASATVWLVIGAFCLAATVTKTGLFHRITLGMIRVFSPNFAGQTLALLVVGTLCAPLIPSDAAKAVLGATLAQEMADAMLYPARSGERCGLFMAAFIGFCISSPAFMSGSVFTYSMYGALSPASQASISWLSWLAAMLPWLLIILTVSYLLIILTASPPKGSVRITREYAQEEYAKLGPMRGEEKKALLLLAGAVLLWVLQDVVHIDAAVTAMAAALLCFAWRLLGEKEISTAVPWALVLHIGGVINLGTILPAVGLDRWIQELVLPLFRNMSTPVEAIIATFVLVLAVRAVMVSQNAVVVMMVALLSPVMAATGVSEWGIGLVILATGTCWLLPFQNTVFISAMACMDETLTHRQTMKYAVFYELCSLLAFLVSIPYWRWLGIIT